MKTLSFRFLMTLFISFISFQGSTADCIATGNGNWNDPSIWSCGAVPGCGDIIVIPSGITVLLNIQVDLDENSSPACSTATYIQVSGTLQFETGFKINLACGSGVEIMPGGSMIPGGGGGLSNWLSICEVVLWKKSDGPVYGYEFFGDPIPLSTEFIDFSVSQDVEVVKFTWTVKSERDNDFFEIEYSENGEKWMPISSKHSIGNHTAFYTYEDELALNKKNGYYKLSLIDLDGNKQELKIRYIDEIDRDVMIFPNPASVEDRLTIIYHAPRKEGQTLMIINSLGQILVHSNLNTEKGRNEFHLEINNLTSGIYVLRISSSTDSFDQKLLVK